MPNAISIAKWDVNAKARSNNRHSFITLVFLVAGLRAFVPLFATSFSRQLSPPVGMLVAGSWLTH
jgi:hypothetical protein